MNGDGKKSWKALDDLGEKVFYKTKATVFFAYNLATLHYFHIQIR